MKIKKKTDLLLLFAQGGTAALFFNILYALSGITESSKEYAQVADKQFAYPLLTGILLYGILSPVIEEILFRGALYNLLKKFFGWIFAMVGSALLFGLYHGNIVQASYGFFLGMLIAFFYERYGSFIVPVLLHSAANICAYIVSDSLLLQKVLINWTGCLACGILTTVLFAILIRQSGNTMSPETNEKTRG